MDKLKHALNLSVVQNIGKNAMGQACSRVSRCELLIFNPPGLFSRRSRVTAGSSQPSTAAGSLCNVLFHGCHPARSSWYCEKGRRAVDVALHMMQLAPLAVWEVCVKKIPSL